MTQTTYRKVDRAWNYVGVHSQFESMKYTYVCCPITADSGEGLQLGDYPQPLHQRHSSTLSLVILSIVFRR